MDIYEGYNYRINIVGADSTIIVDSNTGLVKASISDVDENIIVDIYTKTLYGTLVGNIVNQDLELILDINNKELSVTSILAESYKGNIYNSQNSLVYDSIQNSITADTVVVKNLTSENIITNTITSENIKTGDLSATLINGNLVDHNKDLVFDTSGRVFHGRIFIEELSVGKEIGANAIELYTGCGGINVYNHHEATNSIENNFNSMTFSNARISNGQLDNTRPGDALSYFSTQGYYNNDYRDAGAFFFAADIDKTKYHADLESIPAIFGVYVCNGEEQPDNKEEILSKSFTYNSSGVLSSSIIKTGSHTDNIMNPEKGMIVFNDAVGKFQGYNGTIWIDLH